MSPQRAFVALAGLLHDIGKFRQRALWGGARRTHDDLGAEWVKQRLGRRLTCLSPDDRERLAAAVESHHGSPYDRDMLAVVVADRLAAGERLDRAEEERGDPSREPLQAILATVHLPDRPEPSRRWVHSTGTLPVGADGWGAVFPVPAEQARVDYTSLWNGFDAEVDRIPEPVWQDPEEIVTTFLALLRKYAWCVPAAVYRHEPDVSLVDHLRMTAALAVCLRDLEGDALERLESASLTDDPICLIVGGDVSGIQRFLYAISSQGAAKGLRGRSGYLSLLAEGVARWVLRRLDLPPTNLIYSSGGHFNLLAPLSGHSSLRDIARGASRDLLEIHGGSLAVVLDAVPLTALDLSVRTGRLPGRWAELSAVLGQQKQRLWRDFLESDYSRVVGPFGGGGIEARCAVCHEEAGTYGGVERTVEQEDEVPKCSLCRSFEELGDDLAKRGEYLVAVPRDKPPARQLEWHTALATMGIELWFCDSERVRAHARPGAIIARLNRADLSPPSVGTSVHDFRWVPAFTPLDAHRRIVELEAMADGSGGAPYWACLRLDVDNLGEVFRFGLGERRYSLSRIATLTFMLSLFFEGYVNRICAEVDPEGQHLYLIYSGGDDLLLIGAWDRVVEAARRTREELVRFAGENPSLTVSAGLSLHHAKFPLYQAAREAGDQLDAAKHFRHADGHEKDACGFFGALMSWDDLGWVRRWADGLVTLIEKGTGEGDSGERLSRGFLFKLARIGAAGAMEDRHRRATRQGLAEVSRSVGLHRARWRLVYDVAREHLALRDKLEALREELIERDVRPELVASLVRWVELKTRAREPKERGR